MQVEHASGRPVRGMTSFGFIARGDARSASDALTRHAVRQSVPGASHRTVATTSAALEAWASDVAADHGVLVALRGSPVWDRPFGAPSRRVGADSLLEAYRRDGSGVVSLLAGRFAMAILDGVSARAVLAVDPMGIERLAYYWSPDLLVFGSSAEDVATAPGIEASLSKQALFNYLMLHVVPAPDTIFEGVRKLRAGHMAIWGGGQLAVEPWWRPKFVESGAVSLEGLKSDLRASLATAVADCAPDERTGAFLSGGLDSSTVAGVLSKARPNAVDTFSIGFGYPEFDELSYARIANQRFGCRGHEHTITGDDIADAFALIARAYDEPFGNSSALPLYYCARLARENGMDHLLAGDGGDELFAGNSRYGRQKVFARYERVPAFFRKGLIEPFLAALPEPLRLRPFRRASAFIGRANVPLPERLEIWNLLYRVGAGEVLHPEFLAAINPAAPLAGMQEVWDEAPCDSQLNRLLYYDWQYTLADNDLRKVETMSALAGIRVSYPMLHPDVVDLSVRVPPDVKMPGTALRHFYKEATKGFLPDQIIEKKKHGFGLPFGLWLHDSPRLRDQVLGNLSDLRRRNIVQPAFLTQLLQLHGSDDASYHGVFVWVLAMLEQWLAEHRHDVS
jgi:asparagine synthase (glutamine-hydrolysing)